ncbi:hypothetical protein ROTO_34020 [Roseovarius tolerans]|uniref:Major facilitator superfamily (MFS) profile domain-containing protein n=1 Tax=Roseovarius tolerans TaxID=74031 RepID=A0A0L6CRA9_9RHOB|nr:hypothetical protein [Roseovarius tolerans]KNX40053.1 hypothetical protein ROTO_34020 [Roseovarius tolerans]
MIIGLILIGTVLGGTAGASALLLGYSIWIALLIYTAIGATSVFGLAVCVALRPDPRESAEQAKPYALTDPQGS